MGLIATVIIVPFTIYMVVKIIRAEKGMTKETVKDIISDVKESSMPNECTDHAKVYPLPTIPDDMSELSSEELDTLRAELILHTLTNPEHEYYEKAYYIASHLGIKINTEAKCTHYDPITKKYHTTDIYKQTYNRDTLYIEIYFAEHEYAQIAYEGKIVHVRHHKKYYCEYDAKYRYCFNWEKRPLVLPITKQRARDYVNHSDCYIPGPWEEELNRLYEYCQKDKRNKERQQLLAKLPRKDKQ